MAMAPCWYAISALAFTWACYAQITDSPFIIRISEGVMRTLAIARITPEYPAASKQGKKTGVAVVEFLTHFDGTVGTVNVLDAPDAAAADAVRLAVGKWRFPPTIIKGQRHRVRSKLTFYFRKTDSGYVVSAPVGIGHNGRDASTSRGGVEREKRK